MGSKGSAPEARSGFSGINSRGGEAAPLNRRLPRGRRRRWLLPVLLSALALSGCASLVTGAAANALTGVGNSTVFTGDTDPELVGDAIPFAIKVYEALLERQPNHQGLIVTTGSLFVMYANAFVQGPAEMLPTEEMDRKTAGLARAKRLYVRGVDILARGLERRFPGISGARTPGALDTFLPKMKKTDVPLIYWYVAGTLSAWAIDFFDLSLGMKLPLLTALISRAYELDPGYSEGALDEFFVLFYAAVPVGLGGDPSRVPLHYARALERSGGRSAGLHVAMAQSVCIPAQDYQGFREHLNAALAIDVDARPATRLVNIINQRKARWLLSRASYYFLEAEDEDTFF